MSQNRVDEFIASVEPDCKEELTRKDIEAIQLNKLNALLEKLKESRFYTEENGKALPHSVDSLDDLANLPFTTEQDIVENGPELSLVSQAQVIRVATSGTTGEPKRIAYTESDRMRTIDFFSIGLKDVVLPTDIVLLGFPQSAQMGLTDLLQMACANLNATPIIGILSMIEKLSKLGTASPKAFIGHPDFIWQMLIDLEKKRAHPSFNRTLISGDTCSEELIQLVMEMTGNAPYLHYGMREIGLAGAVSCSQRNGMHIRENDLIIEIVDENGSPVEQGQWGEIVITTIEQEAMPLIRYKTKDRGRILSDPCPCGSSTLRLDNSITRIG